MVKALRIRAGVTLSGPWTVHVTLPPSAAVAGPTVVEPDPCHTAGAEAEGPDIPSANRYYAAHPAAVLRLLPAPPTIAASTRPSTTLGCRYWPCSRRPTAHHPLRNPFNVRRA